MNLNATVVASNVDFTKCWFYKKDTCTAVPAKVFKCEPMVGLCEYGVKLAQFFTPYKYILTMEEEQEYTDILSEAIDYTL